MFDDPVELLDMVCEAGAEGKFKRYMPSPFDPDGDPMRWLGRSDIRSWPQLRRSITEVWKAGEARVNRLLENLAAHPFVPPRDLRRKGTWRDDGEGDFDLDRFCSGQEAWRGPVRRQVIGRQFLTFVVDVAANCTTSADSMYWRAAVAIAAARTLEDYGYGVEVLAAANVINSIHPVGRSLEHCRLADLDDLEEYRNAWDFGGGRKRRRYPDGIYQDVTAAVWIKRPDDPIDLGMLTAVCAPWFFRLAFFGLIGLVPGGIPRVTLGSAVELEHDRIDELSGSGGSDRERVALSGVWTEPAAVQLLKATLKRFADPDWLADQEQGNNQP